tara:strand:- start:1864 stop:2742 length:879 start_codon:yes stop_codon:yes gene_type:complete
LFILQKNLIYLYILIIMDNFNEIIDDTKKNINNFGNNYTVLFILIIVIIIFYLFFSLSGINSESYPLLYFIHNVLWILLVFIILLNTSSYFFNIDIINEINNFFTNKNQQDIDIEFAFEKEKDISLNTIDTSTNIVNKEVFHIPGNKFTYHDAKAICKAFDSEIATYDQLKNAQQNGASWCSYGWTEDQLGLYPTNENDWNKLQNKSDNRYDCGLPGINGGHVKNTHIKMGANCYGIKPEKSKLEKDLELNKNNPLYAKTYKEYIFDKRTNEWKDKLGNIVIKGFNNETWYQ